MPSDLRAPQRKVSRQLVAQTLRQIGHVVKIARPPREQPPPHLTNAVRAVPALFEPGRELIIDGVQ
jgi:hypothetical protein